MGAVFEMCSIGAVAPATVSVDTEIAESVAESTVVPEVILPRPVADTGVDASMIVTMTPVDEAWMARHMTQRKHIHKMRY